MRTIKIEELKQANQDAYRKGELAFQSPNPKFLEENAHLNLDPIEPACVYENADGNRCSVGVCLTEEEIQGLGSIRMNASMLRKLGVVSFESTKFTNQLQDAHDQIVRAKILGEDYEKRLQYFRLLVGLPEEKPTPIK